MNKLRILVANEPAPLGGVEAWRGFWPLTLLERTYGDYLQITYSRGNIFPHEFFQHDILFCCRPCDESHTRTLRAAKSHGLKIIIDFDDNFLNVPYGHADFKYLAFAKKPVLECLALADAVWVTTPALKEVYGAHSKNCVIIPNAILPEELPDEPTGFNGFAMWRGAHAHVEDLWTWRSQYEQILKRIKQFLFIGYMPSWAEKKTEATVNFLLWVETQEWFQSLRSMRPCAIWKPLMPAAINDAKSCIAFLEATIAGGLCVTNYAGKPGWELAWKELPKKDSDFENGWRNAAEHVREHYDLRAWNEVRYRELLKLTHG
mgnify:CR=1 FL=1